MKYMITYSPLEYEDRPTNYLSVDEVLSGRAQFVNQKTSYVFVRARDYTTALAKAEIKLLKIAQKEKITKYTINRVINVSNLTEVHFIGDIVEVKK